MRRLLTGIACIACALVLTGCSSGSLTPAQTLQDKTAVLVDEANAKNLGGLRSAIADLRSTIINQQQAGTLSTARATTLLRLLSLIEKDAPTLTATPTPTPSATPSKTPSPTPTPTPSATPTPTPPPTTPPPTTPPPTTEPPTIPPPTLGVGIGRGKGSASPSATP